VIDSRRLALQRRRRLARAPIDPPDPPNVDTRRPALRARPVVRDVRAHHRPIHPVDRRPPRRQPSKEVRQPERVRALCIGAAVALSQIAQERAQLAHRPTVLVDHRKRRRPVDLPANREADHRAHRSSSKDLSGRP
jgi:hypothetical protein